MAIATSVHLFLTNSLRILQGIIMRLMNGKTTFSKSKTMYKCESEMSKLLPENSWRKAFSSHCTNHWELYQNVEYCWYLKPSESLKSTHHAPHCAEGSVGRLDLSKMYCGNEDKSNLIGIISLI